MTRNQVKKLTLLQDILNGIGFFLLYYGIRLTDNINTSITLASIIIFALSQQIATCIPDDYRQGMFYHIFFQKKYRVVEVLFNVGIVLLVFLLLFVFL